MSGGEPSLCRNAAIFPLLHDGHRGIAVQAVPDGLHLRQDEPAARGLQVDGHHEHRKSDPFPRGQEVPDEGRRREELLGADLQEVPLEPVGISPCRPVDARAGEDPRGFLLQHREELIEGVSRSILFTTRITGISLCAASARISSS